MKKMIFRFLAVMALFVVFAAGAQAQNGNANGNGNGLVGRAIGAFNGGCARPSIGPLNGTVETVGICFNGGFITRVLLFRQLNCQQIDCNAVRYAPVGSVDFDCEGNVLSVNCTWP